MSSNVSKIFCGLLAVSAAAINPCLAERLTFTPPASGVSGATGTITAQVPVRAIGTLALPQGMAYISGHSIQVEAVPEWLFDRDLVLSGAVINANVVPVGPSLTLSGLAYFNNGSWLPNLVKSYSRDTIVTTSGTAIIGNIQTFMNDGLEILQLAGGRRKVLFNEIADIQSPRAYRFSANATAMKLDSPTGILNTTSSNNLGAGAPAGAVSSQTVSSTTTQTNADAASPQLNIQGDIRSITFTQSGLAARIARAQKPAVPKSKLAGTEGGVPNSVIASEVLIDVAVNIIAPAVVAPLVYNQNNSAARAALSAAQNRDRSADVSR